MPLRGPGASTALLDSWCTFPHASRRRYQPYNTLYANVDLVYSKRRWAEGLRFCEAQSVCNVVEVALQLLALRLLSKGGAGAQAGALLALVSQSLTFWKTTLCEFDRCSKRPGLACTDPRATRCVRRALATARADWLIDILEGFSATGHNGPLTWIAVYMLPNGEPRLSPAGK